MTTQEIPATLLASPARPQPRQRPVPSALGPLRGDGMAVWALVLLAAALRSPNLGRAYWIDEGISVGIASHPLNQIPRLLRHDGSPPLFYVLLHGWTRVFGTSEVATHSMALVVSLLVTPAAWWAGRRLFSRRAGLWAAALTATNPFLGWYSTETRMYSLVCLLSTVALTLTVLAVRHRRAVYAFGAVLTFAALLYTHNWALYLVVCTAGVLGVRALRAGDQAVARAVALCAAALALIYLPWLPSFVVQLRTTAAPWAVSPNLADLFADPSSALGGTLGVLIAPLLAVGVAITRRDRATEDGEGALVLATLGIATLLLGWLAAQLEPSWTTRYLAVAIAPLLLAAAGALSPSRRGQVVMAVACVLLAGWSAVGSLLPNPNARYAKSNVAAIARAAGPNLDPGDLVVATQTEQVAVLSYYLSQGLTYVTPLGVVSDPGHVDWQNIVHRLSTAEPCSAVAPVLARLPIGARVLEVNPLIPVGASGSTWSRAAHQQVAAIDELVGADPALKPIRFYTDATSPKPFSAVTAELFVKVAPEPACS